MRDLSSNLSKVNDLSNDRITNIEDDITDISNNRITNIEDDIIDISNNRITNIEQDIGWNTVDEPSWRDELALGFVTRRFRVMRQIWQELRKDVRGEIAMQGGRVGILGHCTDWDEF
jgi:hypothetical protein